MAYLPHSSNTIRIDTESTRLLVHVSDQAQDAYLISPRSTVNFRGEEKTIEQIYDYIKELEDALAEAHLTSREE